MRLEGVGTCQRCGTDMQHPGALRPLALSPSAVYPMVGGQNIKALNIVVMSQPSDGDCHKKYEAV